mmetsp:Transcript_17537/g.53676  ORF Transcript_17537/g.53676 Transcript_17537/m.53676 type:complete len:278 (+) Transcript_17537:625-1458(+)
MCSCAGVASCTRASISQGSVAFFGMATCMKPPSTSKPMASGTTSSMSTLRSFEGDTPLQTAARMAQPWATTVSGSTERHKSASFAPSAADPLGASVMRVPAVGKAPRSSCRSSGMRVQPPTSTTSKARSSARRSSGIWLTAPLAMATAFSSSGRASPSKVSRVSSMLSRGASRDPTSTSLGTSTSMRSSSDSRILASRATLRSRSAMISSPSPSSPRRRSSRCAASDTSRSSPPSAGSPLTLMTSKAPSSTSMTEQSVVPPPMSKTSTRRAPATRMP